ncbi:MAG: thiamine diphosphokinase [Clostridia bacterium]|nr:thiamine diphosphokinase [Clostridia bacterium]
MKKALVISGGQFDKTCENASYDYVIACDKGLEYAQKLNIEPDILIGDFDSLNGNFKPSEGNIETLVFPVEKDDTDTMLAVKYALQSGYSDIHITCALGKRLDPLYANLETLHYIASHNAHGEILSDHEHLFTLSDKEETVRIKKKEGWSLSLFALTEKCEGVDISGTKYHGNGYTIDSDFPLGHGNSIISDYAEISVKKGILLIIQSEIDE